MFRYSGYLAVLAICIGLAAGQVTTEEIRVISDQIWQADMNRITGNDVQYSTGSAPLFTYVNEARFSGPTFSTYIALLDNYNHVLGQAETCGTPCRNEETAFLNAIFPTRPIQLVHNWLVSKGLAPASEAGFKDLLRQYFFLRYTRSGGVLDSSGFEHTFVGETRGNDVTGFHNWITAYFREKSGSFVYGPYISTCPNETLKFSFRYYGATKPISSLFVRSSPELEIALYALCLSVHNGTNCPVRRNGTNFSMTSWDMTGLPKTVGSAYPNC